MGQCWIATGWCGHIIAAQAIRGQEESDVAKTLSDWEKRGLTLTLVSELDVTRWCPQGCPTRSLEAAAKQFSRLTAERDAALARATAAEARVKELDAPLAGLDPAAIKLLVETLPLLRAQLTAHQRALDEACRFIDGAGFQPVSEHIRATAGGK